MTRLTILAGILVLLVIVGVFALAPARDPFAEECARLGGKPLDWDFRRVCIGPIGEIEVSE